MKEELERDGYVYLPKLLPDYFCDFLHNTIILGPLSWSDCEIAVDCGTAHDLPTSEALSILLWDRFNKELGGVYPTYSTLRIYPEGSVLKKHTDRPSSEIGITIQLKKDNPWGIAFKDKHGEDQVFDLEKGDAVIYKGGECEHWREGPCPEGGSSHAFLFYVYKDGEYADYAYDRREKWRLPE